MSFVPADLDWIDVPAYDFMLHAVFKYRSLADFLPYLEWLRYPSTMLLNSRGCTLDCAICGGSKTAYRSIAGRSQAGMRSPEKLVADAKLISTFSRAPIFMVHDPRIGGRARSTHFFELFGAAKIPNELVIETFFPASRDFFHEIATATRAWSLQITIEHTHTTVAEHLRSGVRILAEVQALSAVPEPERRRRLRLLQRAAQEANTSSLVGEDELKWKMATGIRISGPLIRHVAAALPRELLHGWGRLRGRYDRAIATPQRLGQGLLRPSRSDATEPDSG